MDKAVYIRPLVTGIMKCLVSKRHYCLYLTKTVKNILSERCRNKDKLLPFVHNNSRNSATQLGPNQYLMTITEEGPVECRCHGYTNVRIVTPL